MPETRVDWNLDLNVPMSDMMPYDDSGDPDLRSHIVRGEENEDLWSDGMDGQDVVDLARMLSVPVTALCGYTFTPKHNPEKHPVCGKCIEIWEKL